MPDRVEHRVPGINTGVFAVDVHTLTRYTRGTCAHGVVKKIARHAKIFVSADGVAVPDDRPPSRATVSVRLKNSLRSSVDTCASAVKA